MSDLKLSIVDAGELSKPADTLIKKIDKAVSGAFAPFQIRRIARAEADAAIIKAESEIQVTDLHRRAMHRFIEEESQRQKNIEDITLKALPELKEGSDPSKMDDDWVTNFFDKSRIVSDTEMQSLWSRVLAGEANTPGTYSKRTVNFLADLDKVDAETFSKLCGFVCGIGMLVPLVFDFNADIYKKEGVDFAALSHLESIGLIQISALSGFVLQTLPKRVFVLYHNKVIPLELPKDSDNELSIGKVVLTKTGRELQAVCASKEVDGFREYLSEHWKEYFSNHVTVEATLKVESIPKETQVILPSDIKEQ
jgi:hypothetical protein